ncbi:efflux RND transporter permease subunit [Rhodanobacter sp. L36]|uniref:efflux RND transporter permease subunit n=1 Tax=Rhodanobacter sp. L36 TaxID=1747221 RepID=UPI00131B6CE3|nr:efflux RND transporter permease subunit [Rhodanobacter sp. L36]
MNPSRLFILRPVATSLLAIAILLVGLFAYRFLPLSALPEVDFPTIEVVTAYPGAGPEVMASTVTGPLERQLGQMPGLSQMSSTSSGGASTVTLRFNLELPLDVAEQEVQAAINAAAPLLPPDISQPPIYRKVNPADAPVMTLALTSPTLSLQQLHELADTRLVPKLSQVTGVGLVSLDGGQQPAIVVQADPARLRSQGMTLDDLRSALRDANSNQAKGSLEGPVRSSNIAISNPIDTAAEFERLTVAHRDGAVVRLGDVAKVIDGAENSRVAAWSGHDPAIILQIRRQPGANVVEVVDRIGQLLPQLKATLPAAVDVATLTDRTETVRAAVHDTQLELIFAIVLVVLVIFLFLGSGTATVIPGVVVPLSLIGTFAVMYLAGFSINNLTLMALIVATGFMVDDAIVMIENIARYVEAGEDPFAAALKGSRQIAFTVVSLTLSLLAVLIPLLFMGGLVGRLFREFAITLAVAITISCVVSLTLTPMMCARMLRRTPEPSQQGRVARKGREWHDRVLAKYARGLKWVLARQAATLITVAGMAALAVLLYVAIPRGLFPTQDSGDIQGISVASPTVSFAAMAKRQQALTAEILRDPAVASVASFIGAGDGALSLNSGRLIIHLKPLGHRDRAPKVMRRLADAASKVDGIQLYMQPVPDLTIDDRVSPGQYQFSVENADPALLAQWMPRIVGSLQGLRKLSGVTSDQQANGLEAYVEVDHDLASRYGITSAAVGDALYNAFGQRQVSTLLTLASQRRVILEAAPNADGTAGAMGGIYLAPQAGTGDTGGDASDPSSTLIPLSSIAKVSERTAPLLVTRIDQLPAATVSFNLAKGVALDGAIKAVDAAWRDLKLPSSMQLRWQGSSQAFEASRDGQPWLILATLLTVYIVLGVLYESTIHPLTILSTLPSAGIGALLALMIGGFELDVISLIGVILLIGIVQKNAIMLIDFAIDAQRQQGLSPRDAIVQACMLRFRPIIMTTLAAMLGALPLMLGGGMGAELRHPLGVGIFWGLLVSQLLTLFTTPVIYLAFESVLQRRGQRA